MTTDIIDGLTLSFIVLVTCVILCPILCWVLPDRTIASDHN